MNLNREQWWYFTFGYGQKNAGHYVKFYGTYAEARDKMIEKYGLAWAFQYSEEEWDAWIKRCREGGMEFWAETELK